MAATVRSVRFSENLPKVSHSTLEKVIESGEERSQEPIGELPRVYDDALYCPYDIYTAASLGDTATVEAQLQSGFDANRLNGSGWSTLMYAAYLGHDGVCTLLLESGALADLTNSLGQTALMLAATCGNLCAVRLLIRRGVVIDKQDNAGDTALAYATSCSQTAVVEALLDEGANPNLPNVQGMTPTLTACSIGHELTLLALLQNDGDPKLNNAKGENGEALACDNPKAIAILRNPPLSKKKQNELKRRTVDVNSLAELLSKLKLEKYAFGPRKKMLNVIQHYRTEGSFILYTNESKQISSHQGREKEQLQTYSQQITQELMECQQQLAECQQELKQARSILKEHRVTLNSISEACRHSRKIAYAMLEEIRQSEGSESTLQKDLLAVIKDMDNILMKMLELPQ
ncbi:unnamed protein product [Thelazia callipaeda]|uniref:ANK_REP_REGION domain-containing protein n=1 Tax=Thelazia callipaeda TaxID=103827 RepID=A0A0N5DAR3_THECL|nr:unnamed protein product [Thelazia callipaeda]